MRWVPRSLSPRDSAVASRGEADLRDLNMHHLATCRVPHYDFISVRVPAALWFSCRGGTYLFSNSACPYADRTMPVLHLVSQQPLSGKTAVAVGLGRGLAGLGHQVQFLRTGA